MVRATRSGNTLANPGKKMTSGQVQQKDLQGLEEKSLLMEEGLETWEAVVTSL